MNDSIQPLRRSTPSTPVAIEPAYWESIGYDGVSARAMHALSEDLLRNSPAERICLRPLDVYGTPFNLTLMPYHEILLSHWNAFSSYLRSCEQTEIFSITRVELPQNVLRLIVPAWETMNLSRLTLDCVNLNRDGLLLVSQYLSRDTTLEVLGLESIRIDSLDAATALSNAMKEHPSLTQLSIDGCSLGNNNDILSTILDGAKSMKHILSLVSNNIQSSGGTVVAEFIGSNPDVKIMDLDGNKIGDDAAESLVDALKKNTNLSRLNVSDNNFSIDGGQELIKAIFDSTSLTTLCNSNHSCLLTTGINDSRLLEMNHVQCPEVHESRKIMTKCLFALYKTSDEPVNVRFLTSIPWKLIPKIFELIQYHTYLSKTRDPNSLNRVFHVLHFWVPTLFGEKALATKKGPEKQKES